MPSRKAQRKWDKEHMVTLSCKTTIIKAEKFRAFCKSEGLTISGALLRYVNEVIEKAPE